MKPNNLYSYFTILIFTLFLTTGCAQTKSVSTSTTTPSDLSKLSLKELVKIYRPDFLIGTHINNATSQMKGNSAVEKKGRLVITSEYNLVSMGIYQKSTQKESSKDWNFDGPDLITEFAKNNDIKVYAHPMFGSDGYIPDWLLKKKYSNEELLEIIEYRIKTILKRYKGKIDILDVYNEGLDRDTGKWREHQNMFLQLGYHENEFGKWPVALEKMLIWSRKYGGKDLKLIYNDNNNTIVGRAQSQACINMYKALKKEGIPIDGIGIQAHTKITKENKHALSGSETSVGALFNAKSFSQNLQNMGESGMEIYITESDVHMYGKITKEKLNRQAQGFAEMLKACLLEPACKSYKTWGFTDAHFWQVMRKEYGENFKSYPLPFDEDANAKPAYFAMKQVVIDLILSKNN